MIELKQDMRSFFDELGGSDHIELLAILMYLMTKEDGLFSSLYSVLDIEEIYKLVLLYGGTKITIPTVDSFSQTLNTFIAYYYHEIKEEPWDKITKKYPDIDPKKESVRIYYLRKRLYSLDTTKFSKLKKIMRS